MRHLLLAIVSVAALTAPRSTVTALAEWTPEDVGDVVIVDPLNHSRVLAGGGSAVSFTLRLPPDASCPGDSQHDNWRIRSFLVPVEFDMREIVWGQNDPEGENQWSLYGVDSNPVLAELLAANPAAGQPGRIMELRPLTFGVFTDGILAAGHYRLGVACMFFTETAWYWDAEVQVERDPDDLPAQLRWTVVGSAPPRDDAGSRAWSVSATAGAAAVGAVAVLFIRFRRRSPTKEFA